MRSLHALGQNPRPLGPFPPMITPNDFRAGSLIKWKGGIYEVLSYKRSRTAQRRARVPFVGFGVRGACRAEQ